MVDLGEFLFRDFGIGVGIFFDRSFFFPLAVVLGAVRPLHLLDDFAELGHFAAALFDDGHDHSSRQFFVFVLESAAIFCLVGETLWALPSFGRVRFSTPATVARLFAAFRQRRPEGFRFGAVLWIALALRLTTASDRDVWGASKSSTILIRQSRGRSYASLFIVIGYWFIAHPDLSLASGGG